MLNKITFFLLGIIGFTLFLASSIPLQLIASSLNLFLPGTLQVSHITGNIFGPIRFGSLNYDSASTHIHAHSIKVKWSHLGGFPGQVRISSFHIKQLKIQHHSSQQGAPQSIGFPLKLAIPNLVIDQFSFNHTQLHKIHANIDINHNRYRFKQIKAVWNQSQLLLNGSLGSKKPFNINTNIEIHSSFTTMKASLTGSLCRLLLKATGKSEKGTATVYAKLALFNPQVIHDLALQTNRLDLHYLDKKLPLTELTTKAYLHSTNQGAQGYFIVQNSLTGSLTQNKTPISSIHGTVSLQKDLLRIPTFKIALDANGTLTGKARINAKHQDVTIDVTKLNLKAFYPKLYNTKLNGTIHIIRKTPSAHILVYLHGNKIRLKSNLALNHDYIIINKFKLLKNKSVISAKGQFGLNHHHFMLSGFLLNFNPANFGSYITANLGAHFKANGSFKPTPIIHLALKINSKSTLNHHPFTGHVFLTWQHTLTSTDIALILGHNHFSLEGGLSKGHTLHLDANLTALQELGPDFSGHIQAKGNASGAWNHLVSTLHIRGNDIHLPHHISITGIKGDLKIGQAPTAPFKIHVALKKLAVAHHIFPAFLVKIGGTRSNHTGIITLSTPAEKISSRFSGSFQNRRWTGFIQTFTGQGLYNTYLLSPARVKISSQQQNVTNLALNLNGGTIHLSKFLKTSTALHIQGSIHNLPASIIETLPLKLPVQSEGLKINSQFNFTTGNSITGHVTLDIPTGDVRITSLHKRLKLKALHLSCTILNNHFITKVFLKSGLIHAVALTVQGNLTLAHKKPVINFNDPIKTSGYAKNFNTQVLAMIDPHPSLVIDHNLVISSNWNLTYKTGLKGQLSIERNSGNLTFSGLNG
ncbi:MAG: hypothetical protein KGL58_01365, partial [Pseudomonadota bacterium]|nr:hypothetical protein [Pseudomonadota bacterium]